MTKTVHEDLAEVIAGSVNKLFKEGTVAYVGNKSETPSDLTDFVSTGSTLLDLAIANRPHGGIAFGRVVEINGLEGSGKSLIASHLMANVQKMGGVAVLIDTETSVNWDFCNAIGLNTKENFVYAYLDTVEDIFAAIENIIATVRMGDKSKDKPVIIIIDSLAGASTKQEMEATYDKEVYATGKAILISKALRKITSTIGKQRIALVVTNQLRQRLGAMIGADQWTTSGGKALAFHASTRLRLAQIEKIKKATSKKDGEENGKNGSKEIIGVKIKAQVTKNRLGPPYRTAEFIIYFDRGIDDYASWLEFLRDKNIITGRADNLIYTSGKKEHKFTEKSWVKWLEENPELREEIYLKLCNTCIMLYQSVGLTNADILSEPGDEE